MTRRDLMTLTSRVFGTAAGQTFLALWISSVHAQERHSHSSPPPQPAFPNDYPPRFFSPEQFKILQAYTEILIPTDETPGAREAHVAHYIDFVVAAAQEFAPEMQRQWREALAWLSAQRFLDLTPAQRLALVEGMAAPERDRSAQHDGFAVYSLIKEMTVFAFYTSRAGLVDNLEYQGLAYLTEFPACTHAEHRNI